MAPLPVSQRRYIRFDCIRSDDLSLTFVLFLFLFSLCGDHDGHVVNVYNMQGLVGTVHNLRRGAVDVRLIIIIQLSGLP